MKKIYWFLPPSKKKKKRIYLPRFFFVIFDGWLLFFDECFERFLSRSCFLLLPHIDFVLLWDVDSEGFQAFLGGFWKDHIQTLKELWRNRSKYDFGSHHRISNFSIRHASPPAAHADHHFFVWWWRFLVNRLVHTVCHSWHRVLSSCLLVMYIYGDFWGWRGKEGWAYSTVQVW